MNFYWANVDGKLSIDHGGHTATLARLGEKQWRATVILRKPGRGTRPPQIVREQSNGFNTRRAAAHWAAIQIGLNVPVNLMTFASLMLEDWRA
jgi:hypothetical protein